MRILIFKVNELMSKMKTQLIQLALRPLTRLKPKCRNKTRWCSTFDMVVRYFRFKDDAVLTQLCEDVPEMDAYTLTASEERRLVILKKMLDDLHLVTLKLQDPNYTFCEMRNLFNTLVQEYPELDHYIVTDASIVHSTVFEKALVKISSQLAHTLTDEEKVAVAKLKPQSAPIALDNVEPGEKNILSKAHDAHLANSYVDLTIICVIHYLISGD